MSDDWAEDGGGEEWAGNEEGGDDAGDDAGGEDAGDDAGADDGWGDGSELVSLEDSGAMAVSTSKAAGADQKGGSGLSGVPLYLFLLKQVAKGLRKKPTSADRENAAQIIRELYLSYMDDCKDDKKPEAKEKKGGPLTECKVCMNDFDSSNRAVRMMNCGHESVCTGCFTKYVQHKVKDKDVLPWVRCPDGKCQFPCHGETIANSGCNALELYQFADVYLHKHLVRQENWVECKHPDCRFGFMMEGKNPKKEEKKCEVCFLKQTVEAKRELDDEFKKWIQEGKLRPCPVCQHMTMKEYGVCNVIQCGKCGIWWNWKNRETGKSSKDLKDKARGQGTLWEAGELSFQQELERKDPKAFKALLERNGMVFNPNYVRGT